MSDKGNILIVDDQPENLALLEIILTNNGYQVTSATSGRSALETARGVHHNRLKEARSNSHHLYLIRLHSRRCPFPRTGKRERYEICSGA